MKKQNLSFILFIITSLLSGGVGGGIILAQITFQSTISGAKYIFSLQQTTDSGYILTGFIETNADDVALIKTDAAGNTLWAKAYGGTGSDVGRQVQQTTDGGFIITGKTYDFSTGNGDFYLIKTDSIGDTLWTKTFGDSIYREIGLSIQQTLDGGYIITGATSDYVPDSSDVYLIKTNANGDTLWTRTYGGTSDEYGRFVQQTADSGYIIVGYTRSFGAGLYDIYLIKTNNNGDMIWTKTYGGIDFDYGYSVKQTTDGGYIIAGQTISFGAGSHDVYLIKTDANGDTLWTRTFGGTNVDYGYSIVQAPDGGYVIAGETSSFGAGNGDLYLIKTDINGDTLWTKTYGGTLKEGGFGFGGVSVQTTSDSGYVIAGNSFSFGGNGYLIKTDAYGNSGCNQSITTTIVSNTSTQVGSGAIIGSGVMVSNTTTIVSNIATNDSVLCTSICTIPTAAFTYKITSDSSNFDVNFVDFSTNATSWFWDFGDGATDTIQSPTHIYTDSAIYNVCLIVSNSCGSDTLCELVNVWCDLPTAGFTVVDSGLTVNFLDSSMNATSYFWNFGDGAQSTQQDTSHTYLSPGIYNVCLTVSNDCGFGTLCTIIEVFGTGINELGVQSLKLRVFPNPGRGVFVLEIYDLPAPTKSGQFTNGELTIYNMLGSIISKSKIARLPSGQVNRKSEIDISTYPAGIYHLQVMTDKVLAIKKLVLVK